MRGRGGGLVRRRISSRTWSPRATGAIRRRTKVAGTRCCSRTRPSCRRTAWRIRSCTLTATASSTRYFHNQLEDDDERLCGGHAFSEDGVAWMYTGCTPSRGAIDRTLSFPTRAPDPNYCVDDGGPVRPGIPDRPPRGGRVLYAAPARAQRLIRTRIPPSSLICHGGVARLDGVEREIVYKENYCVLPRGSE